MDGPIQYMKMITNRGRQKLKLGRSSPGSDIAVQADRLLSKAMSAYILFLFVLVRAIGEISIRRYQLARLWHSHD